MAMSSRYTSRSTTPGNRGGLFRPPSEETAKQTAEGPQHPGLSIFTDGSRTDSGAVGYAAAWRKGEQWKCHKIHMGYQKPMLPSAQPLPEHWKRPPIDITPLDGRRPYGRPGSDPDANRVNFPGFADRYGRKVFPRSPTRSTGTAGGHDRSRTQYQSEQAPCLTQCSPWSGPDGRPRRPDGILAVSSKLWTDCTGIVRPVRDVWRAALR